MRLLRRLVRGFLRLLHVLALVVFVLGYGARYLPPHTFWWTELLALTLPYLATLLLLWTPFVVRHAGARRWLHLAALLLAAVRFVPLDALGEGPDAQEDDLVLLTMNVPLYYGNEETGPDRTLPLVRTTEPHLVLMQESWTRVRPRPDGRPELAARPYLRALFDTLGYRTVRQFVGSGAVPLTRQPVFVRPDTALAVLGRETHVLYYDQRGDPTQVERTRFRWRGREAILYNLHLRSFGDMKPWEDTPMREFLHTRAPWLQYLRQYRYAFRVRAWEARQIRKLLDEETLPVIIAGDLNSTPHSWVYRHLRAAGLQDAFLEEGDGWGATYRSDLPLVRIDHVLVSDAWEVVSARVPQVDSLSDHRPMLAHLRWASPGS